VNHGTNKAGWLQPAKKVKQYYQMDKTMQTVFIFTHLIMIGAVLSVLYIGLGMEAEETKNYPPIPVV
jgi:hypothetical protein